MNIQTVKNWRRRDNLTQHAFWSRVGVTQSAGSRYESGRTIPKPVQLLLAVAYGPVRQRHGTLNKLWGAPR